MLLQLRQGFWDHPLLSDLQGVSEDGEKILGTPRGMVFDGGYRRKPIPSPYRSPLPETEIMFEFINIFTAIAHSSMQTEAVMMLGDIRPAL